MSHGRWFGITASSLEPVHSSSAGVAGGLGFGSDLNWPDSIERSVGARYPCILLFSQI